MLDTNKGGSVLLLLGLRGKHLQTVPMVPSRWLRHELEHSDSLSFISHVWEGTLDGIYCYPWAVKPPWKHKLCSCMKSTWSPKVGAAQWSSRDCHLLTLVSWPLSVCQMCPLRKNFGANCDHKPKSVSFLIFFPPVKQGALSQWSCRCCGLQR